MTVPRRRASPSTSTRESLPERGAVTRGVALLDRAEQGDAAAVSQLITALEADSDVGRSVRGRVHSGGGSAHVIGVTGAPGGGKSTLVAALATELRTRGKTVGIVAVDPSSSRSGGAILGDRIRMQRHVLDDGVFVRSMSSRGRLGGVSAATVDAVGVLDAASWDVVVVETVGVGQADVEIVQIAHTTVVVSVPGLGDDIQAIKAGLLEVADLHVVNKADRPDADKTIAELVGMLTLGGRLGQGWAVPVLPTVGLTGEGVPALVDSLERHRAWLQTSGEMAHRERAAARARIQAIAKDLVLARLGDPGAGTALNEAVDAVASRRLDPHTAASALVEHVASDNEQRSGRLT